MRLWIETAMRRDIVWRGVKVALIVGTILTAINQGDLVIAGGIDGEAAIKIALTYLVPYCVSTYAGVEAVRAQETD